MKKKIGILGGLTPESTVTYYTHIVHRYQDLFGDHGYPECIIYSVSFQQYEDWMNTDNWEQIENGLLEGLKSLENAGADFAVIATNTMHLLFDSLQSKIQMPLISMIDTVVEAIKEMRFKKIGLIGTQFTMNHAFYRDGLTSHGLEVITPEKSDQALIVRVIFEELSKGLVLDHSRQAYLTIMDRLVARGAEGIVLGCTEIPLLVKQEHTKIPLFDTSILHAEEALRFAIRQDETNSRI